MVGGDPPVAGKGEFEGAAEAGAVDRRHHRLAAGLEPPEQVAEAEGLGVEALHRLFPVPRRHRFAEGAEHAVEHVEVGAAGEGLLARGDDGAGDRLVRGDPFDDRAEFVHHREVEHVHRPSRHVPGHGGDAVFVDLEAEVGEGHGSSNVGALT